MFDQIKAALQHAADSSGQVYMIFSTPGCLTGGRAMDDEIFWPSLSSEVIECQYIYPKGAI